MTLSDDWENFYKNNKHISIWPWTDLVQLVMRNVEQTKDLNVLELGCGAGANIPFFLHIGANYYAIEGSSSIVEVLHKQYPSLSDTIKVGDFTRDFFEDKKFDLVIDRGALTHNKTVDIKRALKMIDDVLVESGKFIGTDWFSTAFSEIKNGESTDDPYTYENFKNGKLNNISLAHFNDLEHIKELFSDFYIEILEHKEYKNMIPDDASSYAAFNIVAKSTKS